MEWKEIAAIWGALTGTISLAMQVVSWPRFYWRSEYVLLNDELRLVIENPSQTSLLVSRFISYPKQYKFKPVRLDEETVDVVRDVISEMRTGRLPILVGPGETREVEVEELHDAADRALIIVVWRRFWFIPIRVVKLLWISRQMARDIRHGAH